LLAGDRDEAEVPDRSAIGLGIPVDDNDAFSQPGGGQRMGKAANTRADDGEIVRVGRGRDSSNGDLECRFARMSSSDARAQTYKYKLAPMTARQQSHAFRLMSAPGAISTVCGVELKVCSGSNFRIGYRANK
jgi:hypothetical protein